MPYWWKVSLPLRQSEQFLVGKPCVSLSCWCSRVCSPPITFDLMLEQSCSLPAPSISISTFISCPLAYQILLTVALVQDTLEWKCSDAKIRTQLDSIRTHILADFLSLFATTNPVLFPKIWLNMLFVCVFTGVQVTAAVVCSHTPHPALQHACSSPVLFLLQHMGIFSLP